MRAPISKAACGEGANPHGTNSCLRSDRFSPIRLQVPYGSTPSNCGEDLVPAGEDAVPAGVEAQPPSTTATKIRADKPHKVIRCMVSPFQRCTRGPSNWGPSQNRTQRRTRLFQ